MAAPQIPCPRCKAPLVLHNISGKILCKKCDFIPTDRTAHRIAMITGLDMSSDIHPDRLRGVRVKFPGMVNGRALAAYASGEEYLQKGQMEKAKEAFSRALESQPDLIDAHLQLAKLSDDVLIKVQHINTVLDYSPKQEDAFRMAMVLMGAMTAAQEASTYHHNEQVIKRIDEVSAKTQANLCPICGGRMSVEERTGKLKCPFCGHEEQPPTDERTGISAAGVSMALVKRKAEPMKWVIGKRLLHCNQCGAERTVPARKLTAECPFCGTPQVIVKDVLSSFQQPDGIVPFALTREAAGVELKKALRGTVERIKGMFDSRRVEHSTIEGVYLPFWVFDAAVEVAGSRSDGQGRASFPDWVENAIYCAVDIPARELTDKLGAFDLHDMVPYAPKLLADYPAELYTIDFDKASLDVRPKISQISKEKYDLIEYATRRDSRGNEDSIAVYLQNKVVTYHEMIFQLVLFPVWLATLVEQDGDVRLALINGQTGKVTLGKVQKEQ
jgi:Zn finger protein HypA/HybF involved in hydrogenase expression